MSMTFTSLLLIKQKWTNAHAHTEGNQRSYTPTHLEAIPYNLHGITRRSTQYKWISY